MNTLARDTLREIRDKIDLVELIQEYVPLKRVGANYHGLCPFHQESKPSFTVSPAKQIFHCFGCQTGGSAFDFVMQTEGLDFSAALGLLAKRAGVEIQPRDASRDKRQEEQRERYLRLNRQCADFFRQQLTSGKFTRAKNYLAGRGVSIKEAEKFNLGYAPPGWEVLTGYLRQGKASGEDALKLGLLSRARQGTFVDRFRERLIFPIQNVRGEVVGFGGRAIGEGEPKYLNSPETPLYHKGRNLYGIKESSLEIRRRKCAFLVEGYLDCIAMHAAGFANTVSPLGTALTEDQIKLLKRYTDTAVFVFDGDSAGQQAVRRALGPCLRFGLNAEIVVLPTGHDPDSFLREKGAEVLAKGLERRRPLLDYYLGSLFPRDAAPLKKTQALKDLLEIVRDVQNPVHRGFLLQRIADQTGLGQSLLEQQLKQLGTPRGGLRAARQASQPVLPREEELLLLLMAENETVRGKIVRDELIALFNHPEAKRLAQSMVSMSADGHPVEMSDVLDTVSDSQLQMRLRSLFVEGLANDEGQLDQMVDDCCRRLRQKRRHRELRDLSRQIDDAERAGDGQAQRALLARKTEMMRNYHEKT